MADDISVTFQSETSAKVTIQAGSSSSVYWMIFKPAHAWSRTAYDTYVRMSGSKGFKSVTNDGPMIKITTKSNTTGEIEFTFPVVAGSAVESICFMDTTNGSDSRFTSWRDLCKSAYTYGAQYLSEADVLYDSIATDYLLFERLSPLATPTGLNADQITSNSARTNWQAVENASNYKVQYKAAGDTVWMETYTD